MTFAYYAGPEAVKGLQKVPRQRGESHEERAEDTGRDPIAGVLQESGRSDAGRKNNP